MTFLFFKITLVILLGSQLPIEVLKNDATSNLLNALIFAGNGLTYFLYDF